MEVREEVMFKELEQALQRKQSETQKRSQIPKESSTLEVVKTEKVSINQQAFIEEELVRLIMQYGDLIIELKDEHGETYQTTVVEEIIAHFEINDFRMSNEVYQSILEDVKMGIESKELRVGDFFIKLFDQDKPGVASEAMIEKYSISENWKNKWKYTLNPKSKT